MNPADPASRPSRPASVTVLAWIVIVASALGSLISAATCLMLIAGSYGTSGGMTLEGLAIIAGPPATLFAGIGLLRRQRWAWFYMLALPCAVLVWSGLEISEGSTPEKTFVSESGTRTTVSATSPGHSVPLMAISIGVIVLLLTPRVRTAFVARKMSTPPPLPTSAPVRVAESAWTAGPERLDPVETAPCFSVMSAVRFLASLILSIGIAGILWTQTGPFAWVGGLQLALTGRYSVSVTLVFTIVLLLVPVGAVLYFLRRGKSEGVAPGYRLTGMDRAISLGGLVAAALVLAFGLAPLFAPRPDIRPGELRATIARASLIPAQANLSLSAEAANIDLENSVTITATRHSAGGTIYAPIHAPGSAEVLAIVSGRENDWRNASITALPFANEANEAALARSRDAILTLQPVPLIVRRELAAKQLPVPVMLPAFEWGRSPLAANLPLIVGGGSAIVAFLIALVRPRNAVLCGGRPADL